MSKFITQEDYDASIHREILDALTRSLNARYDVDEIFSAEGEARNQLILMLAIDITVYHLFSIHNPQKISQIRKDRYERAVEWLKQVAAYKITVDGAPLLPDETLQQNNPYLMKSNPKRINHM